MDNNNDGKTITFRAKGFIVVVLGALGLAALFYGSGIGTENGKKSLPPPTEAQAAKPVRAMNLALGPMVFLARELDFTVKNLKGEKIDDSRIAGRIETQLSKLRDLYRQEIAKNPRLVGSMVLQFNIEPSGQVSQIKEVASRLTVAEFRKTVISEAGKWTLAELVTEPVTVRLPLLFVQEGMDITTLVRWENALTEPVEKLVSAPSGKPEPAQKIKAQPPAQQPTAATKPTAAPVKTASSATNSDGEEVQIKYATLLRKEPNFTAPVLTTFTIGTRVTVINRSTDWLEVRSQNNGPSGFIRKEFAVPVDIVVHR
jgi:hypothetical protein